MKIFILVVLLHTFLFGIAFGNAAEPFKINKDGMIDVDINNLPLNEALRNLSAKFSIELKGYPVGNEQINLNVSNIPLDEMLKRMMRGYNYVLIKPENSQKSVLMVLSKAERTKYTDAPSVTVTASPPPSAVTAPPVQQPMAASRPQQQPNSSGNLQTTTSPQTSTSATGGVSSSGAMSSASALGTGTASRATPVDESLMPPMPPQVAGLDLPPMPPGFTSAKSSGTVTTSTGQTASTVSSTGSTSSSQQASVSSTSQSSATTTQTSTPPAIPSTSTSTSTSQTKPDVDLRPPSMPF